MDVRSAPDFHALHGEETSCEQEPESLEELHGQRFGNEGQVQLSVVGDGTWCLSVAVRRADAECHGRLFHVFSAQFEMILEVHVFEDERDGGGEVGECFQPKKFACSSAKIGDGCSHAEVGAVEEEGGVWKLVVTVESESADVSFSGVGVD